MTKCSEYTKRRLICVEKYSLKDGATEKRDTLRGTQYLVSLEDFVIKNQSFQEGTLVQCIR